MDNRKAIVFPKEFTDICKKKAEDSCRTMTLYIQFVVKEFWKMEEMNKTKQ